MEKTLPAKMHIRENERLLILNAPQGYVPRLTDGLPANVHVGTTPNGEYDVLVMFAQDRATLQPLLAEAVTHITRAGWIWVAYPKGGKKALLSTDLNRDNWTDIYRPLGLRPAAQISIDETWSALRFCFAD